MPSPAEYVFSIAILRDGRETESIPFESERLSFGRDASNHVSLPDGSVSRVHAELTRTETGILLADLGSRNGVRVNGVPRMKAMLQIGDSFEIGIYQFRLRAGGGSPVRPGTRQELSPEVRLEQTISRRAALPEVRLERHLATIYHASFWLTECTERPQLIERISELLHESLGAEETQYFSADLEIVHRCGHGKKPAMKFAEFLAKRFQAAPEAMIVEGPPIGRHQRGVDKFNYLVGPVRRSGSGEVPVDFLVLMKPVDWELFTTEDRVLLQAICQLWARESEKMTASAELRRENRALKAAAAKPTLLGSSAAMEKLRGSLRKAAGTKATILLHGETGSGKEVVAQFIHENSPRADKPFVKVNCSAIPDGLIESELFGHVKGAFTDAKENRKGKFTQASGGTIFLDEIGEMPLSVQAKVLRVLENSEIEPLGSERVEKVDVRVITATHRDLEAMIARKEFRQDLYFRLNVFGVRVPPLRDHLDDLPELAGNFLEQFCRENGLANLALAKDAVAELKRHSWPGNVRELRNVVHRCAISASGPAITAEDVAEVLG